MIAKEKSCCWKYISTTPRVNGVLQFYQLTVSWWLKWNEIFTILRKIGSPKSLWMEKAYILGAKIKVGHFSQHESCLNAFGERSTCPINFQPLWPIIRNSFSPDNGISSPGIKEHKLQPEEAMFISESQGAMCC